MPNKKSLIALTGGGTAGHVMPHVAMLPYYQKSGYDIVYIGSAGIEKELIQPQGIEFKTIAAGKLRRYFSAQNFIDVFKVGIGCVQAFFFLARRRPQVVFSKGGFVSVPVAVAARLLNIPVISHESDLTPGLANRIIAKFASKILYSFPQTKKYVPSSISEYVGAPIRSELLQGDRGRGKALCGFDQDDARPILLVMGGSLGAKRLNDALLEVLPQLVMKFDVIHIVGRGKSIDFADKHYKSFEYVGEELKDIFAATDYIVSRAGANSIFEFLALGKPMLLVPLEVGSRGDQVDNAECFVENGWALMLRDGELNAQSLTQAISELTAKAPNLRKNQGSVDITDTASRIFAIISSYLKK